MQTLEPHVSLAKISRYSVEDLQRTIQALGEALPGGWDWIRPGDRVLLKPNLLRPSSPDEAITTHPSILEATARLVRDAGGIPFVADSPAGPHTQKILKWVYAKCGMREAAAATATALNEDTTTVAMSHSEGKLLKHLEVIRPLLEADAVINLPKAKTHIFMIITGAVKNLFGLVPGLRKPGYHSTLKEPHRFADMLLDLVTLAKPAMNIMDGIIGMDGDGPSAGKPRRMDFVLAGRSAVHVDWAFCQLIGLKPTLVPVLESAMHRGWLNGDSPIEEAGPIPLSEAKIEGFHPPQTLEPTDHLRKLPFSDVWASLLTSSCTLKPHVPENACKKCGICVQSCPQEAIRLVSGPAKIDHSRCIRCYCCHEVCPDKLVELRGSLLYRCLRPLSGRIAYGAR